MSNELTDGLKLIIQLSTTVNSTTYNQKKSQYHYRKTAAFPAQSVRVWVRDISHEYCSVYKPRQNHEPNEISYSFFNNKKTYSD